MKEARRAPSPTSYDDVYAPSMDTTRHPDDVNHKSPPPGSSPSSLQFQEYLDSLSPMKSDKRARYTHRFSMGNFPIPQPVFATPRSLPACQKVSGSGGDNSKREGGGGGGGGGVQEENIGRFIRDDDAAHQLCSPPGSVCVDQYLADPLPVQDGTSDFSLCIDGGESSVAGTSGAYALANESAGPVSGVDRQQSDYEQHQCGIRRYLQFETAKASKNSSDGTHDMTNFPLPDRLEEGSSSSNLSQILAHDEPRGSSSIHDENCAHNLVSRSYSFPSSTFTLPRNMSLLTSQVPGTETTSNRHLDGNPIAQEEKIMPGGNQLLINDLHSISMPSAVGAYHAIPGPTHLAVDILQQSSALMFTQCNIQVAPSQSPQPSQTFDVVEELNQMTPERIRKRSRNNNETKGCKRCNCKRSRCLKLYCECFSAGLYCVDSCSCENCLNKADYEDTVLDIRRQIELRNPHAFAPKVVEQDTGSPANTMEELNQTTPSSARHKRGCNCKKSKCVKKYCECYQGNVGCSEGCRCENCENPFGTKAGVIHRRTANQENQSPEQLDLLKTQNKYTRIGRPNQSSPTWEPLSDISNLVPVSHPYLGSLAFAPRATLPQENSLYSLAGHPSMQFTPTRFTPKFDGSLTVENFPPILHNGVYAPPVVDHTFPPRKISKAGSSNETHTSPEHGLRASLSQVSQSGRKSVPLFPPLSP